jgi:hypothetical protein
MSKAGAKTSSKTPNTFICAYFFYHCYLVKTDTSPSNSNSVFTVYDNKKAFRFFQLTLNDLDFIEVKNKMFLSVVEKRLFRQINFLFLTYVVLYQKVQVLFGFSKEIQFSLKTNLVSLTSVV